MSRCFGFLYANTFYYYIPTVLPNSFNNYKPGKILIIQLIEWCIKNNIKKFDFGLGNEKYKKYFSNKEFLFTDISTLVVLKVRWLIFF